MQTKNHKVNGYQNTRKTASAVGKGYNSNGKDRKYKKRKAEELASGIEPKRRKPYKPRTKKTRKAKLTYF